MDERERSAFEITGEENLLVLAAVPGEVGGACGGLIGACCRRGRPPFVMVLTDGVGEGADAAALAEERAVRAIAAGLGLPDRRLLMAGLHAGRVPVVGPGLAAVVRGVGLVMWARDCNVVLSPGGGGVDQVAAAIIAAAVAGETGVGRLTWGLAGGMRLEGTRERFSWV